MRHGHARVPNPNAVKMQTTNGSSSLWRTVYQNETRCKLQTRSHLRRNMICRKMAQLHLAACTETFVRKCVPEEPHTGPRSSE